MFLHRASGCPSPRVSWYGAAFIEGAVQTTFVPLAYGFCSWNDIRTMFGTRLRILSMNHSSPPTQPPLISRLSDVLAHTDAYAFKGVSKLLGESGIGRSLLFRMLKGECNPSFVSVVRVTQALEKTLGRSLDPRELLSEAGNFPTRHVCELMRCSGCLPESAYDEYGDMKSIYRDIKPGHWVTSRHPRGF
jgi:hypothetical protein